MAIRLLLALALVVGIMWYLMWYQKADNQQRNQSLRTGLLYGLAGLLLILVVTGRISWIFALVSAAIPWINRFMTARSLWSRFKDYESKHRGYDSQQTGSHNHNRSRPNPPGRQSMSREEAFDILGLAADADEAAIIQAHKTLMQKHHPDRGGSDYFAAKINRAKAVLLGE